MTMPGQSIVSTEGIQLPASSKSIVLVGLMGAGKSCIGRQLAHRLGLPFHDADTEIERAAGCSVAEIFTHYGETAFRDVERRVIARLLDGKRSVLATGGGAFMDPATRAAIRAGSVSIWLRADLDLLLRRTGGRSHRPLLNGPDPASVLQRLIDQRYPVYAEADLVIDSRDEPPDFMVTRVQEALSAYLR